jgi:hypothetical protein
MLILLDAGLPGFPLIHAIKKQGADFIGAVQRSMKLEPIRKSRLPDGSYYAWVKGKVEVPEEQMPNGRRRWRQVRYKVRVFEYQIPGFRTVRMITSLVDPSIPAEDIARHYHVRWEVELVYDAVKVHQCGTRKGHCPTVLRSKRPDLVEQEILAVFTAYNLIRSVINKAATSSGTDPRSISFVESVETIIHAIPPMRVAPTAQLSWKYEVLLTSIAECELDQWRRPRKYPRVVKVKMSCYKLKRPGHQGIHWDPVNNLRILGAAG